MEGTPRDLDIFIEHHPDFLATHFPDWREHITPEAREEIRRRDEMERRARIEEEERKKAAAKPRKRFHSLTVPCPFVVIQDTREQAPWGFAGIPCGSRHPDKTWAVTTRRQGLATGDYSIAGWEKLVCIERKSLPDLYHSIGAERDRFEREFQRMQAMNAAGGFAALVIEADAGAAVQYPPPNTAIPPTVMLGTWAHWTLRYGVHWYFLPDRTAAEHFAFRLLEGFRRQRDRDLEEALQ